MATTRPRPPAYQLHEGRTWKNALAFAIALLVAPVAVTAAGSLTGVAALAFVLVGVGCFGAQLFRPGKTLRMDEHGLTERIPVQHTERRTDLAWHEVQAVVLLKLRNSDYIGVVPVPGRLPPQRPLPYFGGRFFDFPAGVSLTFLLDGHLPRLRRLAKVLGEVAPHVAVVDIRRATPVVRRPGDGAYLRTLR